jgi:hypothetical protein
MVREEEKDLCGGANPPAQYGRNTGAKQNFATFALTETQKARCDAIGIVRAFDSRAQSSSDKD